MKANENNIFRFLGGTDKKFIIPVYQRPYSWKKENCIQLLKDLKDVHTFNYESHFFGSIFFVSQNNGVCEEHTIIDGQQRITTVSLLLLAMRNYVSTHLDLNIKVNPNKITNVYLTDMLEFANYYNVVGNPEKQKKPYSNTLSRINKMEVKTCVPLIMDLFKANADGYISDDEMCSSFEVIENYIVRREICDLPTNALNKVFVQLGAEIDKDIEDDGMSYYDAFRKEIIST